MTRRLYWEDDHCFEADATVAAVQEGALAFDRTCFYPGGGGQPADEGVARFPNGETFQISSVYVDPDSTIWHVLAPSNASPPDAGLCGHSAKLIVNSERRIALSRYHTVLHILNTIALRDHGAWITGAQIATDYARIDFRWDGFSPALCGPLEHEVNLVIDRNHSIAAYRLTQEEFATRPDLLRTLEVKPPVINGHVRVVAIRGFDEQACGGTHVDTTADLGRFSIYRTENKGKINKRLYVRLDDVRLDDVLDLNPLQVG